MHLRISLLSVLLVCLSSVLLHAQDTPRRRDTISPGLAQFLGDDIAQHCVIEYRPDPTRRRISRFSEPLLTSNPGECCQRCIEMSECIGWIWHACCNHCWIQHAERDEDPSQTDYCNSDDCVVGTVARDNTTRTDQDLLEEIDRYINDQTFIEYLPAYLRRCDKEYSWHAAAIALQACTIVKRRCGLPRTAASPDVLQTRDLPELQASPSCQMKNDMNYWGYDMFGYNPHPARQTAEECCRRCQLIRGCRAWTRLPNGECYLKYSYNATSTRDIAGHVSGVKIDIPNVCSRHYPGVQFIYNRDGPQFQNINNTEECCQACLKEPGCLVWSFGETYCLGHFTLDRWRFRINPNYTSGFITPVNDTETCEAVHRNDTRQWNLRQLAYNLTVTLDPNCYSILNGTHDCGRRYSQERAETEFHTRVNRSLEALGMDRI